MTNWKPVALAAALMFAAMPAAAQNQGDGPAFIQALRSGDDSKAASLLSGSPGLANSRDGRGETPLLVAVTMRNEQWIAHLLNNGADPSGGGKNGDTPLIVASRIGFETAAQWLLESGAKANQANRMGETPLIVAVQQRRLPLVKLLLAKGADPDKTDAAAGYSAREYAKRDTRTPQMLRLIEAAKKPSN